MASRNEKHRIMHGSMNVLAPGDKIQPGDAMLCDNFRVDKVGVLRTRGAAVLEGAGTFGTGIYHTLRRTSDSRYSGVGADLWWGPEPAGTRLMASGFDGLPLGMAFYQGQGWVMNRNVRKRIIFDQAHNWGVEPPATAPVATPGDQPLITLEPYDGSSAQNHVEGSVDGVTWSIAMDADAPAAADVVTASFDTAIATTEAASLKMVTAGAASILSSVRPAVPFNTQFNGLAGDEDMFRLFVWASDPKAIKSMTVRLVNLDAAGNETAWAEANFKDGSSWDPAKTLSQTPQSWTELLIRRVLNVDKKQQAIAAAQKAASDGTGNQQTVTDLTASLSQLLHQPALQIIAGSDPQILAANNTPATPVSAFDWTAVARVYVSFALTSACEIHLENLRVVSSTSTSLTGSIEYFVTFFNNLLQESNPSPPSAEILVNGQSATLTSIATSADPDALGRYIYRIGGSLNAALRVGTLWDNTSTGPWVDPTSDEAAQDDDFEIPDDHDPPPPARGVIGPYYGKLIAWSSVAHKARFWWTKSGVPYAFPGALDDDIGNWEDVGGDDDELLVTVDHKQGLIFYKQRSIWRLVGDPENADPVRTNANIGVVGPQAVDTNGQFDYFVGPEGVYSFNGDFENKVSGPLDPIFKGEWVKLSATDSLPPINRDAIGATVLAIANNRLRVSYPEFPSIVPNVVALMDIETGEWCREKFTGLPAAAPTAMNYEGAGRYLVAGFSASGSASAYDLELNDYRVDNGAPYTATWQSRHEDQGLPDDRKVYSDVEITFETAITLPGLGSSPVSTLSVYAIFDKLTKVLLGTISSATETTKILRVYEPDGATLGRTAKSIAIRIEGSIAAVAQITSTYVHWYPEERTADTFDSGPTNLGIPERVKEVDYIEFYTTANGQLIQRALWSDLPGSVLVSRESIDFRAPNGRGNYRQRLAAPIDGRNFRLTLANDPTGGIFQAHQVRLRCRVIGEYIDGTIGEYYESPEFSVAPGRVGELKDFLLDYDVSGAGGRMELYSDLPGHQLALIRTLAIPYVASGRSVYVFPLENAADTATEELPAGQLFKVRLYPPPGGILRLHGRAEFRARIIGVYFEGANGEVFETQDLDLAGGMAIFQLLEITAQSTGALNVQMFTELPNQDMRLISGQVINPASTTTRRVPFLLRLPGNCKGELQRFKVSGSATARILGLKVYGRRLEKNGGAWQWFEIPFEATLDAWLKIQMPVRATPEEFTWIDLPVDAIE